jgi:hypothetical protein
MSDELSDAQIALLCDIEEHHLSKLTGDKKRDLEQLLLAGYAEPVKGDPASTFRLTVKGSAFLSERGVGHCHMNRFY